MEFEDFPLHSSRCTSETSMYETTSRDSGYDDISQEALSDDCFLEEFSEIQYTEDVSYLPTGFNNLIRNPITPNAIHPNVALGSPLKKKVCQRSEFAIKRTTLLKKSKSEDIIKTTLQHKSFKLFSSEEVIKSALQKSCESDLVGDFTRRFSLPLTQSRHKDLKAIDGITLTKLIRGEFSDKVSSYKIIDCRYPYEYDGGHITGAYNIYSHGQCEDLLNDDNIVDILIFHCEFSAERGPNLSRYLRKEDRRRNTENYPKLCFPEIYILEGGYRQFFSENPSYCSPNNYVQMIDSRYTNEFRYFRQKCKTLDSDTHVIKKKNHKTLNVKKLTF
ncbi:hypothetical protein GWI33_003419 [Rhynchophorus ferrugineus]|uniref:protein-tyrosine-phosphatase n=1 Tax=Rhynchophorus ferrugineus TaxID=354439 RepID=A0A834ML17_RHYFE|nr:hypothetical protein GWI33_003419 [Rhynchophorus ferrugineus]